VFRRSATRRTSASPAELSAEFGGPGPAAFLSKRALQRLSPAQLFGAKSGPASSITNSDHLAKMTTLRDIATVALIGRIRLSSIDYGLAPKLFPQLHFGAPVAQVSAATVFRKKERQSRESTAGRIGFLIAPLGNVANAKRTLRSQSAARNLPAIEFISISTAVRFNLDLPPSSSAECVVYGDFAVSTI
jgi:hypothetical protein